MRFEYNIESGFLSYDNCDELIKYFTDKLTPSSVIGDSFYRNSDDFFINPKEITHSKVLDIIQSLKSKFSSICQLPLENQELLTIIRYQPGQRFETHFDSFTDKNHLEIEEFMGGQRVWTFIVCLREALVGGLTKFDNIDKSFKLKTGQCLYWKNTDESGQVFTESLHSGLSPESGEKWILSCWIRENKHIPVGHHFISEILKTISKEQLKTILEQYNE